ncbi:low temperature requirement protein A [Solihabitans fulvus]|uniref:Low temperature requirement protein A n=1 Tax=Solihabitans fulvus TaxID=1892852 RepID=A0A5B2WVF6_9PSEU|nr:low temperature requirement protein A [Solihabitans fulvus]KAA2254466.1 low temperature requirement protein A [Solihabitans fulvus]
MSEPVVGEKRVTWAELLFDLVFVFAVTQTSALLHVDHSWAGVGRALVLFVPVYWAWVGTSVHANTHEVDNPVDRLGIFAAGLGALFMALAIPAAYGDRGVLFGASYLGLRVVLAVLLFRNQPVTLTPYTVAVCVSGPLLLVGGLLPNPVRVAVWALAAVVDLATPMLLRTRLLSLHFEPAHLPERFGLLVIIALGESVVAIGAPAASSAHLGGDVVFAVMAAFALVCGLWWVYFVFAASAVRHAMETAAVQTDILRQVLSYGHLAFIAGIIAVAVGMAEAVAHPLAHLNGAIAGLLFGGCALYLASFGYTRWRMFRKVASTRLAAAAVVLALLPAATLVPALAALVVLVVVLGTLNLVEHVRVHRAGQI